MANRSTTMIIEYYPLGEAVRTTQMTVVIPTDREFNLLFPDHDVGRRVEERLARHQRDFQRQLHESIRNGYIQSQMLQAQLTDLQNKIQEYQHKRHQQIDTYEALRQEYQKQQHYQQQLELQLQQQKQQLQQLQKQKQQQQLEQQQFHRPWLQESRPQQVNYMHHYHHYRSLESQNKSLERQDSKQQQPKHQHPKSSTTTMPQRENPPLFDQEMVATAAALVEMSASQQQQKKQPIDLTAQQQQQPPMTVIPTAVMNDIMEQQLGQESAPANIGEILESPRSPSPPPSPAAKQQSSAAMSSNATAPANKSEVLESPRSPSPPPSPAVKQQSPVAMGRKTRVSFADIPIKRELSPIEEVEKFATDSNQIMTRQK